MGKRLTKEKISERTKDRKSKLPKQKIDGIIGMNTVFFLVFAMDGQPDTTKATQPHTHNTLENPLSYSWVPLLA